MDSIRAFAKLILSKPHGFEWTIQGFGMLRTHIPGFGSRDFRLNVWHSGFRVKNVSLMHDHPWHFDSYVVNGCLLNLRFEARRVSDPNERRATNERLVRRGKIQPGMGARPPRQEDTELFIIRPIDEVEYNTGETYGQRKDEVHVSDPIDGTITFNERMRVGEDIAHVFWAEGSDWVSAAPRRATTEEINLITKFALGRMER